MMSDKEEGYATMEGDHSPRRDASPRRHKDKSYSRSRSRSRGRDRDRRHDSRDREYSSRRDRDDRSRSRSRSDRRYKSSRHSRSDSRSPGSRHSHSPMSSRRRHMGTREHPKPSRCLGVFGLSVHTTEDELYHLFNKYGPVERVQVILDAKTGRSRGFSFVYFESTGDAKVAKEQCSGLKINGKSIRVDFSITERAHTPTPGIYMGKPTYRSERYESRGRRDRDSRYRRSPSPYYSSRSRRRYSRSRSYSPRRY